MISKNKRVLILDDNEDMLELVKEIMLNEGYEAEGFTSTDDIIQLVKQHKPDLVITDYILSGINGGEYCHQIKVHPDTSHIPVVMLSAFTRVLESLGNYGWDAFIAKPFSLDEITSTVKNLLKLSEENCCV